MTQHARSSAANDFKAGPGTRTHAYRTVPTPNTYLYHNLPRPSQRCILPTTPSLASQTPRGGPLTQAKSQDALLPQASPVYKVIVSVVTEAPPALGQRHLDEKARLLERMSRKHGKFDEHHPRNRLLDALYSFSRYAELNRADLDRWRDHYRYVSRRQHLLLESTISYSAKFDAVDALIATNAALCDEIVRAAQSFYGVPDAELAAHAAAAASGARGFPGDKVSVAQALKHFVRDWSAAGGRAERAPAYACVLDAVARLFPDRVDGEKKKKKPRILLPGAGLGRLGHEVAALGGGLEVTVNEWSMYMNAAYRFLTSSRPRAPLHLHPFIDGWSHHRTTADQLRAVPFPDADPLAHDVLLVEGDFTTVFAAKRAHYDAVLTFFFIDTARNLMAYLETVRAVLAPGGHWVNFGPLLYGTGPFVQLSLEEVVAVAEAMGFEFVEQEWDTDKESVCGVPTFEGGSKVWSKEAVYGFDDRALTRNAYSAQFWVARKKEDVVSGKGFF
ncbi:uncharacterized protein E0L32_010681 [Thyridium curvatum]|uniref:Uncharacterized protein n=1 Tax=Thyridium curvatum TaxID=1093900 RepID=A0A507AFW3_9PEZI|nr:uncharacterized protein E0L32_010681 [Thyridium curvatum]TPX07582.1 hypothetical protein E0L32_010681 [Thyridium curvatum]